MEKKNFVDFSQVAMTSKNSKWENSISRLNKMYQRIHDYRTPFERDTHRILHSNAYRRLKHKTQVFFATSNDHICTRMEHVSHVASIAETISKNLNLNTELVQAIAMGHDLGHAPFGHQGEYILGNILKKEKLDDTFGLENIFKKEKLDATFWLENIFKKEKLDDTFGLENIFKKEKLDNIFWHEKNSLHFVDNIETLSDYNDFQQNLNLTYAVRDGIVCHCGEVNQKSIKPRKEFIDLNNIKKTAQYSPYTYEGCVVKISDKIAYLGRDIEDALTYKILSPDQTKKLKRIVQLTLKNRKIKNINSTVLMHYFIIDLCKNSDLDKGLCFSHQCFRIMKIIKKFNEETIYMHKKLEPFKKYATLVIETIYDKLISYFDANLYVNLKNNEEFYPILNKTMIDWLIKYSNIDKNKRKKLKYKNIEIYDISKKLDYQRAIIDFISGMTDQFAIKAFNEIISF